MDPARLAALLKGESRLSARELAANKGDPCSDAYDAQLRRVLKGSYDARALFTAAYIEGAHFKYGAVNPGNAGALLYGSACVIPTHQDWDSLAVLPGDSPVSGFVPDGSVATDRIYADVRPWDSRCDVATIKLHAEACRCGESR
jgi:hypothetical protein